MRPLLVLVVVLSLLGVACSSDDGGGERISRIDGPASVEDDSRAEADG